MGYIDFTKQDGSTVRLYIGKISGLVYDNKGKLITSDSIPKIEYFGTPLSRLLKGTLKDDIWQSKNKGFTINIKYQPAQVIKSGEYDEISFKNLVYENVEAYKVTTNVGGGSTVIPSRVGMYGGVIDYCDFMLVADYDRLGENKIFFNIPPNIGTIKGGVHASEMSSNIYIKIPIGYCRCSLKYELPNNTLPKRILDYSRLVNNGDYPDDDASGYLSYYYNASNVSSLGQKIYGNVAGRYNDYTGFALIQTLTFNGQNVYYMNDTNDENPNINPNSPTGDDTPDFGGNGDEDSESDTIPQPQPPPVQYLSTAFMKAYVIDIDILNRLGKKIWTDNIFEQIFNVLTAPIDTIIGLISYQCDIPHTSKENIKLGNIDSGIEANVLSLPYITLNFGNLLVPTYYNTWVDYTSTDITIYLPYIGAVNLPTFCLGQSINLQYNIDIMSGNCIATIKLKESVIASYQGNCGYMLPVTGRTGNPISDLVSTYGLSAVTDRKYGTRGYMTPNTGFLGVLTPYVIITLNPIIRSNLYNNLIGIPNNMSIMLSQCQGFTQVKEIKIDIPNCTDIEKNMIEKLLKDGIFI